MARYLLRVFLSFFLFSPLASAVDIQTHFNKILDEKTLLGALSLDMNPLITYIEQQGVLVRYMSLDDHILNDQELSLQADAVVVRHFRAEYQRDGVIGAYLSPQLFPSITKTPLIVLTDLTSKWTLLHEFIHHLFEKERLALNPYADSALAENQQNAREYFLEIYSKRTDPSKIKDVIKVFCEYVEAEIALSKNVSLEEIAIEKLLIELENQNAVSGLNLEQKIIAQNYIKTNKSLFLGYLEKFAEIAVELQKQLAGEPHPELAKAAIRISSLQNELQGL